MSILQLLICLVITFLAIYVNLHIQTKVHKAIFTGGIDK